MCSYRMLKQITKKNNQSSFKRNSDNIGKCQMGEKTERESDSPGNILNCDCERQRG